MAMERQTAKPMSRERILAILGYAFLAATLIVLGAVLPAEFNRDPLGIGALTGLSRLSAPSTVVFEPDEGAGPLAREYPAGFRSDTIEIPLRPGGDAMRGDEVEYKVHMAKDATLVYQWSVPGMTNADEFYYDFHGHTLAEAGPTTVASYKATTFAGANGALTAPFDGVHGWYYQNQSGTPVVVYLKLAGYYELIPAGEPGNEAGIVANVPASEAFGAKP